MSEDYEEVTKVDRDVLDYVTRLFHTTLLEKGIQGVQRDLVLESMSEDSDGYWVIE